MDGIQQRYMGMMQGVPREDAFLIDDISRAVILEVQAYNFYEKLVEMVQDKEDKQAILIIQRDEAKHYYWFTMFLNMLGAQIPQIPAVELPQNFRDGVKTAIKKELDASAFYQDIAYKAQDHRIQMHFMHAAQDEQRHALWLQNMLL